MMNIFEDDKFDADYFLTTNENAKCSYNLYNSADKLSKSFVLPKDGESIRMISPANGWSSCSLLLTINAKTKVKELIASTLRVGKKEIYAIAEEIQPKKAHFIVCGISKEHEGKYDYAKYFEAVCAEKGYTFKYARNHSKVLLIKTDSGEYAIETSSNLNENPKVEQFIITKSNAIYEYYIKIFEKLGML